MMKLRQDLVLRKVGDDYIMVDPGQGMVDLSNVHTLNETAAWLWEQLAGKEIRVAEVVELLCAHYEVSKEKAAADAESLLAEFEKAGLFEV